MAVASRRPGARLIRKAWAAILVAAATGVLLFNFLALAWSAIVLARFPFGIDYGEGIVWQQMRNMLAGQGYAPLGVYPAIVYHYPPVYHLTTAATIWLTGADPLAAGRMVSWISTVGSAALIGWLAIAAASSRDRFAALLGAVLAGLIFMSCEPVVDWLAMMRVDMLACMLGFAGLAFALGAVRRPPLIVAAALCFVLAIYTKQISIAAPAAAFVALLAVRPRAAWQLLGLCFGLGLIALGVLSWSTDGGFLRHILLYNVNRMRMGSVGSLLVPIRMHAFYEALALAGCVLLWRRVRFHWAERQSHARAVASAIIALAFLAFKTPMLVLALKSGANVNYLIEWYGAVAVLAGVALVPVMERVAEQLRGDAPSEKSLLLATAVLLGVAVQAYGLPHRLLSMERARAEERRIAPVVELIRRTHGIVICDDMTLLLRAGRAVEWEPAIVAELGVTGRYDQAAFVRMIAARRFRLFITDGDRGDPTYNARYNPPVADAMARYYPRTWRMAQLTIHAPAG